MLWIEMTSSNPPLVTRINPPKCNQRISNYVSVGLRWHPTCHGAMIAWDFFEFASKCFAPMCGIIKASHKGTSKLKSSYGKMFKSMVHCVQTLNSLFKPHGGVGSQL